MLPIASRGAAQAPFLRRDRRLKRPSTISRNVRSAIGLAFLDNSFAADVRFDLGFLAEVISA